MAMRRRRIAGRWGCGRTRAPLTTRLTSKAGNSPVSNKRRRPSPIFSVQGVHSKSRSSSPPSPCNAYIGDNFTVRLHKYFKLNQLVRDENMSGVVHTEFNPLMKLNSMKLSTEAQKIMDVPNAGGTSVISEVLSFEVLRRVFGATLMKTEMEVTYFPEGGSITDYMVSMFDTTLGVSVTRAMKYKGDFTEEDAMKLLNKKLNGILQATQNTMDRWKKQILHVWATSTQVAKVVTDTFNTCIQDNVKSNTVVLVTMATNSNEIFFEKKKKTSTCQIS